MHFSLILFGPTASGKTDFSYECAHFLPAEIINADVGQVYVPLTIGTAKPDLKNVPVAHHMFDMLDKPIDYSAFEYRCACMPTVDAILGRRRVPVFVGGCGFYIKSLFFPLKSPGPCMSGSHGQDLDRDLERLPGESPWDVLFRVDPDRARNLHPNDLYKIGRALDIRRRTGVSSSFFKPTFDPSMRNSVAVFLDRDRRELEERATCRIDDMMKSGWIKEAVELSAEWRAFVKKRGFIGYEEIFDLIDGRLNRSDAVDLIRIKTLQYIKRQYTFWRSLKKMLVDNGVRVKEINISHARNAGKTMTDCARLLCEEITEEVPYAFET